MKGRIFALFAAVVFCLGTAVAGKVAFADDDNGCAGCKKFNGVIPTESEIAKQLSTSDRLIAFEAYRKSDTTVCKRAANKDACYDSVQLFALLEAMAKGRCEDIPSRFREDFQPICVAARNGNCSSIVSPMYKNFCQGIVNKDESKIAEVLRNPMFPEIPNNPDDVAEMTFKLFLAFKDGNRSCTGYKTDNILVNNSCNMLLGTDSLSSQISSVAKDMRIALDARRSGNKGKCSNISNDHVKSVCNTGEYDSFEDLLDLLWR